MNKFPLEQGLAIALGSIPALFTVWFGILLNNRRLDDFSKRIDEMRDRFLAELRATQAELRSEMAGFRAEMNIRFDRVERRLEALENERRIVR